MLPTRCLWSLSDTLVTLRSKRDSSDEVFIEMTLLDIEKEYGGTESGKRPGFAIGLTWQACVYVPIFNFSATPLCQLVWLGASYRRSWARRKAKSIRYLSSRAIKTWGSTRCSNTSRARVLASETLHFQYVRRFLNIWISHIQTLCMRVV